MGCSFRTFGPLRYARITVDKATGRTRGSGFVCFWNTSHADAVIAEAQRVVQETGSNAMLVGIIRLLTSADDFSSAGKTRSLSPPY